MTPVASRKSGPLPTFMNPKIHSKEVDNVATHKQVPAAKFTASRELMTNEQENTAVSVKPSHRRRPSTTKLDIEGISVTVESGLKTGSDTATLANFQNTIKADAAAKDSSNDKASISTSVTKEIQKATSPDTLPQEKRDRSDELNKELKPVKYVNGVAVVHGRTRSLVERFEKREKLNTDETQNIDLAAQVSNSTDIPTQRVNQSFNAVPCAIPEVKFPQMPVKTPEVMASEEPEAKTPKMSIKSTEVDNVMPMRVTEAKPSTTPEKTADVVSNVVVEAKSSPMVTKPDVVPNIKSEEANSPPVRPRTAPSMILPEKGKVSPGQRSVNSRRVMQERVRPSPMLVTRRSNASPRMIPEKTIKTSPVVVGPRHDTPSRMVLQKAKSSPSLDDVPQTTGRGLMSKKDDDVADDLMKNHDVFVSGLRARLTKLQVVRHFWGQNDTKGAINALGKLPDHAVQADVVNVLMERMESLTLDHFSSLLPVLLDLLDSKTERHISVSLELLLKLVAVFGSVISSTISAPPTVGVDLHAEKRLECCNECHIQLQKIHKCLPDIIRRGGLPARCAQELNIVLHKS